MRAKDKAREGNEIGVGIEGSEIVVGKEGEIERSY